MKSVLMVLTNEFDPDVRVYKEAKYLVENKCKVTILCWDRECNGQLLQEEVVSGINVIRYRIPSQYGTRWKQLGAYLKFLKECKHFANSHDYDYIHCHDIDGAIIGSAIKKKNKNMIFDMHEVYEHGGLISRFIWRNLTIWLLKKANYGLYVTKAYLHDNYKCVREKLRELRNYPDSNLISPLPKTDSEFFRIGYHGVVRNQIEDFKALFQAVSEMNNVRVDIHGGGIDLQELQNMQKEFQNIYVHGPYDGIKESSRLYSETDLLFCAYDSNDPNYQGDTEVIKFYEAIFTGTPILVTRGIGMEKKVTDRGFGLACNTRDKEEIKTAVNRIRADRVLWNDFHQNELEQADQYSWEKAVQVLDEIYQL